MKSGRYRSFEINRATLELIGDCLNEREAVADLCVRKGFHFRPFCDGAVCVRTPKEACYLKIGLVAALAIKMGNNPVGQNWDDLANKFNSMIGAGR